MDYLKLFENHSEYETFVSGGTMVRPNVSHCVSENEVHYNPLMIYNVTIGDNVFKVKYTCQKTEYEEYNYSCVITSSSDVIMNNPTNFTIEFPYINRDDGETRDFGITIEGEMKNYPYGNGNWYLDREGISIEIIDNKYVLYGTYNSGPNNIKLTRVFFGQNMFNYYFSVNIVFEYEDSESE